MKRKILIKHLNDNYCQLLREGAKHSFFINIINNNTTTVPRHPDIKQITVYEICNDLDIDRPAGK
jgi:mRNA interferase HicA